MKHFILLFSVLIALSNNALAQNCTLPPELQNGLVGYWPFCGNANDESGNGNDGVVNGATLTEDRFGNSGSSYYFNNSEITVDIPNSFFATDFTIASWVKLDEYVDLNPDVYYYPTFIAEQNDALIMQIELYQAIEKFNCYFLINPGIGGQQLEDGHVNASHEVNNWTHVVLANSGGINSLYINGVLVDVSSGPSTLQGQESGSYLKFGDNDILPTIPFNGSLDDIGIWNRALTAEEIAQLYGNFNPVVSGCTSTTACNYNALATTDDGSCTFAGDACDDGNAATTSDILGADCACAGTVVNCAALEGTLQEGLVGYWPFCGNANDESGNGNDGVVNGATLTEDRFGNVNGAFDFNHSNIITPLQGMSGNNPRTISFWYNFSEDNTGVNSWFMVGYGGTTPFAGSDFVATSWPNSNNDVGIDANTSVAVYDNNSGVSAWHHFVAAYDPSFGESISDVKIYVDGILQSSPNVLFGEENIINTLNDYSLRFGQNYDMMDYIGKLDDIGIWNRALTADEIALLYGNFNPVVSGCTSTNACNYNALATTDDGSCTFAGDACDDGNATTTNDILSADCACTGTVVNCPALEGTLQEGLVGYWPFCGNANDESGNGNNGVVNGATLAEDRFGNAIAAYNFNGVNAQIQIDNVELDSGDFTISGWLNSSEANGFDAFNTILSFGIEAGQQNLGLELVNIDGLLNQLRFTFREFIAEDYNAVSPLELLYNDWFHVVMMRLGNQQQLYINSLLVSSTDNVTSNDVTENGQLFLGTNEAQEYYYTGHLDDIGIWNRALSAEEIALLYGNFNPQVSGCTDPLAFNYNPQATINEGCQYTATIFVYNDLNGNGEHEADEPGLSNWPVLGNDINGLVWTNSNGNVFLPLAAGQYEFTVLNPTDNWINTSPTSVTIDLSGGPATAAFGLQVIPGEAIVAVGPYQGFADIIHCTDGFESGVYLENIGSQAVSGFMTLTCDPLFTPDADSYFTTPPVEVGPGYALWNVEDFQPGEYELLSFHIDGPGVEYLNQSFTFAFDLTLFDPQGNMIYSDNWSVSPIVACAYDPNDITGFPEGLSAPHEEGYTIEHYILPDNMVEFRVRFQNTGTLPAEDIDIYIPIDPNQWELSTIFPLMRSAEMQVICLHDDGLDLSILEHELPEGITAEDLLIFSFDDINLPDSASDPEGSQGYVYFRMQAKHTLSIGDEINAQAFIYFEENPPIATNETYHVLFDCESFSPMVGDAELCAGDDLQFSASQPNVDEFAWSIATLEGSGNIFIFEGIDAGEYTLELNTSNMLCPQGEDHEVTIIVYDTPMLDLPLDVAVCAGEQVVYEAESDGDISWSNGASTSDVFTAEESFTVTATAVGAGGCSASEDWTITVNPLPSAEVDSANFVLTAADGVAWQWSVNGVLDATTQSINATENGNYQVEITSEFGCVVMSDVIVVELPIPDNVFVHSWSTLSLFPNPMTTSALLELPQGVFDIALYDHNGTCVRRLSNQQGVVMIESDALAAGVYQIQVTHGANTKSIRLVVE